jgi:transcriptional regulator with XRE-family HTH domain
VTERAQRFNGILGKLLLAAFNEKGRSQRSIATAIGINNTSLTNYTAGRRDIPVPVLVDACEEIGERAYTLLIKAYEELLREEAAE